MAFLASRTRQSPWFIVLAAVVTVFLGFPAEAAVSKEFQVKAVFLFNFAQFVDWPPDAFSDPNAAFVIGILGDDPFGTVLDDVVANEAIHHHPVVVRRYQDIREATSCHILYIGASEAPRLTRILSEIQVRPILTVGEASDFAARNGVIQFILAGTRLRLRINVAAARAARLSISSQLLRQADLVEGSR